MGAGRFVLTFAIVLLLDATLPTATFADPRLPVTDGVSCYECNVFRGDTGKRVQCQEYTEDPDTKFKNWIIVPIASGKIPLTKKICKACGTYVTWSENHHRKPRGGDESQVTLVISRFCMKENVDSRFWGSGCVDDIGSHSIMRRCFCFTDNCNNYDAWSMTKFGP